MSSQVAKVLLVEDEEGIAKPLIKLMKFRGYDLVWVKDGQEALDWLTENGPEVDCLLVDIMMPRVNGWEFRRLQREKLEWRTLPAILLSADSSSAKRAAIQGEVFVAKPIDLNLLERRLVEATQSRRLNEL